MNTTEREIRIDPALIAARRRQIRDDAPCDVCGTTLATCRAERGKDPTAPPWFGCCARGPMADIPCSHRVARREIELLLDEIQAGCVRSVEEVRESRTRRARERGMPAGIRALLDQGEWWRQRDGSWVRIVEMSPGHRYNSAAMFMRAADIHAANYVSMFAAEVSMHDGGDVAHNSLERELDDLEHVARCDPAGWLSRTPLYLALTQGLTIQGDGTQPWQKTARDPVTGQETEVPPPMVGVCEIPACGCSGEAHA